ncbi:PRC-barrel domain-containing protein [Devosia epidermidihirudinis]|uniref:PRC-barrel domain-containing protein n=1 Tax=Devosia epidermidihirudinis TaxID=1293439 RepID=UPI0006974009|nr:PRC-barrel domain-containing protein [Devosia epidermidihirudinis]
MIRTLLTTTTIAALMTAGVMAQDAAPAVTTTVDGAAVTTQVRAPWDLSAGYTAVDTDNLGTHLIGQPVYSSRADDAENIGNISDIVFDAEGQITAVVIGVGGFLGIGEKSVAVDFHSLEFVIAADQTERWVVPTTADALKAAPEFVWRDDKPAEGVVVAPAPAGDVVAPAPVAN